MSCLCWQEADIAALDDEEDQLYQEQSKLTEQLSSALEVSASSRMAVSE